MRGQYSSQIIPLDQWEALPDQGWPSPGPGWSWASWCRAGSCTGRCSPAAATAPRSPPALQVYSVYRCTLYSTGVKYSTGVQCVQCTVYTAPWSPPAQQVYSVQLYSAKLPSCINTVQYRCTVYTAPTALQVYSVQLYSATLPPCITGVQCTVQECSFAHIYKVHNLQVTFVDTLHVPSGDNQQKAPEQ